MPSGHRYVIKDLPPYKDCADYTCVVGAGWAVWTDPCYSYWIKDTLSTVAGMNPTGNGPRTKTSAPGWAALVATCG